MRLRQKFYRYRTNIPVAIDARELDPIITETDWIVAQELSTGEIIWFYGRPHY